MSDLYPPEMGPTPTQPRQPRADERKARSATFWRRTFVALAILGVVGVLVFATYGIYAIRQTQTSRLHQAETNDKTLAIVKDCTQPAGECNKRNQKQLASAIADIGAGNILAVVCALQVENGTPLQAALDEVTRCVADRLTRDR